MVLLEAMSVRDTRECMSLWDGCSVLWMVKAVVYAIGVDTVYRVLGIIDGVYVFHLVLVMEDGCGDGEVGCVMGTCALFSECQGYGDVREV